MRRLATIALAAALICGTGIVTRAADGQEPAAVIDKAIKAMGGEEALGKVKMATWKSKGTITFNGMDNTVSETVTVSGLDHYRQVFEGEFGGNAIKGVTIMAGDKGSRAFGGNAMEMDKDALANQKRTVYLAVAPVSLLPLKSKDFKLESIADDTVDGKPAAGLKVTGPDMKDFKLYFSKETGLPVKLIAKVPGFQGDAFTQETTYSEYKDMAGIKKATKVVSKRDGEKFISQEITEFKVLDTVDPKTFTSAE